MGRWLCASVLAVHAFEIRCDCEGGVPGFDAGLPEDAGATSDAGPQTDAGSAADAAVDSGTPDAGTPDSGASDAGAPDAGTSDAGTSDAGLAGGQFDVYFAAQTTTQSLLVHVLYDAADASTTHIDQLDLSATFAGAGIRVLLDDADGGFLIGGTTGAVLYHVRRTPLTLGGALTLSGRDGGELTDITGACVLTNGDIIAQAYTTGFASEFTPAGAFVRDLGPLFFFYLIDCTGDAAALYATDNDVSTDHNGFVRSLQLNPGGWVQTGQITLNTFGGATSGAAYAVVLHTSGDLYLPPQAPGPNSVSQILRCPAGDLTACAAVGPAWPVDYPLGAVEGAAQLPGQEDLLLIDSQSLYRFRPSDASLQAVYTLGIPNHQWTRMLRIRPAPPAP